MANNKNATKTPKHKISLKLITISADIYRRLIVNHLINRIFYKKRRT